MVADKESTTVPNNSISGLSKKINPKNRTSAKIKIWWQRGLLFSWQSFTSCTTIYLQGEQMSALLKESGRPVRRRRRPFNSPSHGKLSAACRTAPHLTTVSFSPFFHRRICHDVAAVFFCLIFPPRHALRPSCALRVSFFYPRNLVFLPVFCSPDFFTSPVRG